MTVKGGMQRRKGKSSDSHKRPHIVWFPLYEVSRIGRSRDRKCSLVVASGCGKEGMGSDCSWVWGFFRGDVNILKLDGSDGCTILLLN